MLALAMLLPPPATRVLLHEVDDQIEETTLGTSLEELGRRRNPLRLDRWWQRLAGWLPEPVGEDPAEIAYAGASARRLAARRTGEALEHFGRLPNIAQSSVEGAREVFAGLEREAVASLEELDSGAGEDHRELSRRQAEALSRVASRDALDELVGIRLLPEAIARRAAGAVAAQLGGRPGDGP